MSKGHPLLRFTPVVLCGIGSARPRPPTPRVAFLVQDSNGDTKHEADDEWDHPCVKGGGVSILRVPVKGAGQFLVPVANCHLCHWPYEAFINNERLPTGPNGDAMHAVEAERKYTLPALTKLLSELKAVEAGCASEGRVLGSLLCGDFNSVSHLDYFDHMGTDLQWPCTLACEAAGLEDTYAAANPSDVGAWRYALNGGDNAAGTCFCRNGDWTVPPPVGETWGFDRIDFVMASREGLTVDKSATVDHRTPGCDPWPSDHRAVVTDLRFRTPQPTPSDVQ